MSTASEVVTAAMSLNAEQRSDVAYQILLSLEPEVSGENVDRAWETEIRRRQQLIRDGKASLRDWDAALASIRESIAPKVS